MPPGEEDVLAEHGVLAGHHAGDLVDLQHLFLVLGGVLALDLHVDLRGADAVARIDLQQIDGRGLGRLRRR